MELQQIIETVCDNCQCTYAEIKGKSRMQNVVFARYFITDILRRDKKYWTLELIGLEFNRNHSTVINYISKLPMIIQSK
jgi:chromosomal replication initiation ATPase DnaA